METPSTPPSTVEKAAVVVVDEDVDDVDVIASPGPSPPTTKTIEEEEAGKGNNVVRVTATEDQFRSVFSNSLVSSKLALLKAYLLK